MSHDGKEPSVLSRGLRSYIMANKAQPEKLARPSKWSPGVEVLSAEEYDRFTDQLARELLATCTPEHIAVIAAQHMMDADALRLSADELACMLRERTIDIGKVIELATEIASRAATETATEAAMAAYRARRKHDDMKRAAGVKKGKADVMALARSMATEWWHYDTEQKLKTGPMAKKVYDALLETEHRKLVASEGAVRRWIKHLAPVYATKPGP